MGKIFIKTFLLSLLITWKTFATKNTENSITQNTPDIQTPILLESIYLDGSSVVVRPIKDKNSVPMTPEQIIDTIFHNFPKKIKEALHNNVRFRWEGSFILDLEHQNALRCIAQLFDRTFSRTLMFGLYSIAFSPEGVFNNILPKNEFQGLQEVYLRHNGVKSIEALTWIEAPGLKTIFLEDEEIVNLGSLNKANWNNLKTITVLDAPLGHETGVDLSRMKHDKKLDFSIGYQDYRSFSENYLSAKMMKLEGKVEPRENVAYLAHGDGFSNISISPRMRQALQERCIMHEEASTAIQPGMREE